jgi:hypothetical protein
MKRALILLLVAHFASASSDQMKTSSIGDVIHVATALDHLTVLEFGEPVTMAAAGSTAFQIERHADKVFIKPLKSGASTDLLVWTASRRFTYELEPPGEVRKMNFAVENFIANSKPVPDKSTQVADVADMILTRAFLATERIDSSSLEEEKGRITVRIEQVFQSKTSLYVHYSIVNHSARPYRVPTPRIIEALAPQAAVSLVSLRHKQLDGKVLRKLGELNERALVSARSESKKEDLQPGEETHGVVSIREQFSMPTILRLTFGSDGPGAVQATLVF